MEAKRIPQRASTNGVRNRLTIRDQDPAYIYRIVNDIDDRVQVLMDVGYEVAPSTNVGDKRAGAPSSNPGSPTVISLGAGDKGVVMRIKKDLYAERRVEKDAKVRELETALQDPKQNGADYGKVKLSRP